MGIDHVNAFALTVRDVKKCAEFYRDKVGMKVNMMNDEEAYLSFGQKGAPILAIIGAAGLAKELPVDRIRPNELPLQRNYVAVFLEDADKEYETLVKNGVKFLQPPATRPNGQRYAFFEDPEGNLWEISHFPKKQG
jgi:catechol 2,3-dioxygenase-like lactoylglutathione lyase family enzyme